MAGFFTADAIFPMGEMDRFIAFSYRTRPAKRKLGTTSSLVSAYRCVQDEVRTLEGRRGTAQVELPRTSRFSISSGLATIFSARLKPMAKSSRSAGVAIITA